MDPKEVFNLNKENPFKGELFQGFIVIYFIKHISVVWICVLPIIPLFGAELVGKWYQQFMKSDTVSTDRQWVRTCDSNLPWHSGIQTICFKTSPKYMSEALPLHAPLPRTTVGGH